MLSGVSDPRCPPHDDSRSLCHCMTSFSCRSRGWPGVLLFSTPWRFCFAPRAGSGRSGWASSPALRPACACDPSALPAVWPLGVGVRQPRRFPTTASASGALTLRRHGSCGPRGGSHRHPPVCDVSPRTVPLCWAFGLKAAPHFGRGAVKPPGGWRRPSLRRPRGPQRADPRWGNAGAVSGEQRGALPRDVSRPGRDRTRRRVGGLRSMCSPSDRS
jgi:hypothetical protein